MKERPILFSTAMVRTIIEGRKTQTRRAVKPQPNHRVVFCPHPCSDGSFSMHEGSDEPLDYVFCPYGQKGDRLGVRETWAPCLGGPCEPGNPVLYRADDNAGYANLSWRSSIHIPRWASRIALEITEVRVQRVQEITPADAVNEGVECSWSRGAFRAHSVAAAKVNPVDLFSELWDSINAKRDGGCYTWTKNPWVWAITFRVL